MIFYEARHLGAAPLKYPDESDIRIIENWRYINHELTVILDMRLSRVSDGTFQN